MNLSFIYSLFFAVTLGSAEIKIQQLLGKWQLVHFDGIDRVKKSPEYQNSDLAMRVNIEYKIKSRLENTIYNFIPGDSLVYTDYVNSAIVLKKAKIELKKDSVLTMFDGKQMREAKIVELEPNRMVLEPISSNANGGGKLVFERIIESEKK